MNPAAKPETPGQTATAEAPTGPSKPAFVEPRLVFVEPQLVPCGDLRQVTTAAFGELSP